MSMFLVFPSLITSGHRRLVMPRRPIGRAAKAAVQTRRPISSKPWWERGDDLRAKLERILYLRQLRRQIDLELTLLYEEEL